MCVRGLAAGCRPAAAAQPTLHYKFVEEVRGTMESKPLELLDIDEMHDFLAKNSVSAEVLAFVRDNGVTGSVFLELTGDDLKEMAPRLADRVVLRKIQNSADESVEKEVINQFRYITMLENHACWVIVIIDLVHLRQVLEVLVVLKYLIVEYLKYLPALCTCMCR